MMRRLLVLACWTAGIAAPAMATGITPADRAADQGRSVMRIYTACLVDHAAIARPHAQLVAFLNASPTSSAGSRAARDMINPDCLRGASVGFTHVARLRFKPDLLRGEIFRAMYLAQTGATPRVHVARTEIEPGFALGPSEPITALQRFGDCAVAADPANADAAIRGEVDDTAETRAYQAIGPALGGCLPRGNQWRFSRAVLEGVLAEGLYRRATAPAATPIPAAHP